MENQNYELFLKSDVSRYIGEWVAICDKKIVSHGKSVREVVKEANQKYPGKRPLIVRIPEKNLIVMQNLI